MKRFFSALADFFVKMDYMTISIAIALSSLGLAMIYSATRSFSTDRFIIVQSVAFVLSVAAMFVLAAFDFRFYSKMWKVIIAATAVALVGTLVIGYSMGGNKSWIAIGSVNIQTSEIAKITFSITFATHLYSVKDRLSKVKTMLGIWIHMGLIVGLVLLQGDMGSALVFVFMSVCMMFAAGVKIRYFIFMALVVISITPVLWIHLLKEYQRSRILVGFNPQLDPQGYGFQPLQSLYAIQSGGLFGLGYMDGVRSQSNTLLPAKHTDFIFGIIGEELGFVGAMAVVLLLAAMAIRILYIALHVQSDAGSIMCVGIFAMIMFQMCENIGMCLATLPVIGITLPFLSYGGSSILSAFCGIGLVQSVYRHQGTEIKYTNYIKNNMINAKKY